jgi:hypothetical protein
LRIENTNQINTFILNDVSYNLDKLLPVLEIGVSEGKKIHMEIFIKGKLELDILLVSPNFSEISSFIRSFPKMKLYRSLHYFIPRFSFTN